MAGDTSLDLSRARRHEVSLGTVSFETRNLNRVACWFKAAPALPSCTKAG